MKKSLLILLTLISSIFTGSYSRDYVVYEDEPDYIVCDEPEYVICDEPDYIIEQPVYYIRKPVVRERVVVREPRRVCYVNPNPAASLFAGLAGFGLGAAIGAACSD